MKKIKILLIAFGILCTLTGNAQEEFFKRNTGLSLSGSSDFSSNNSGELSLHLKNGLFFSGSFLLFQGGFNTPTMATIGYLFDLNKRNETNKINAFISLSDISEIPGFFQSFQSISPTLGIMYTSFQNSNYPTSLGLSATAYFEDFNLQDIDQSTFSFYFAQAFFARKTVYPVIGLSYSIPLSDTYRRDGLFLFHVGLNIRLSKAE